MRKAIEKKQHLMLDQVLGVLQNLGYPTDKIIAKVDLDGFPDSEIYHAQTLSFAIDKAWEKGVSGALIIFRVNAETKSFAINDGENNHYVALDFSANELNRLVLKYIDPTGENVGSAIVDIIKNSNRELRDIDIQSSAMVLQYTQPVDGGSAYQMGGNDYDCGVLLPLAANLIRKKYRDLDQISLDFEQSKVLGQVLRGPLDVMQVQNIEEILEEGRDVGADADIDQSSGDEDGDLDEVTKKMGEITKNVAGATADAASSDASPDSSDEEYGAKTLMRKVFRRVRAVVDDYYKEGLDDAEISVEEIRANPGKYYIANFRGDKLNYFADNISRRRFVKVRVDGVGGANVSYKSIAVQNIAKEYEEGSVEYKKELSKINAQGKLKDVDFIKSYKSPAHVSAAVKRLSPVHGNPIISTSKDPNVTTAYADHCVDGKLHPKYRAKKPKHRLIGMQSVFVHEACQYLDRDKADVERLRSEKKIGGKSGVERENKEIMFSDEIESVNVAGYVPMIYPNLSKKYNDEEKALFGIGAKQLVLERINPISLGKVAKKDSLYPLNRRLQWRLAEQYVKEKHPEGQLLWVDVRGVFRKFSRGLQDIRQPDFGDAPDPELKSFAAAKLDLDGQRTK